MCKGSVEHVHLDTKILRQEVDEERAVRRNPTNFCCCKDHVGRLFAGEKIENSFPLTQIEFGGGLSEQP